MTEHDQAQSTETDAPQVQPEAPAETAGETASAPAEQPATEQPAPAEVKPKKKTMQIEGDLTATTLPSAAEMAGFEGKLIDGEPIAYPGMNWFTLRVASNKENYVRDTLLRKIEIEGLKHLVNRILVPTEKTKTVKGGKQRIQETKLYPGYVFVEMRLEDDGRIPQDVFFLIKETTGVGDFVGTTGRPTALAPHEVEKMLLDSRKPEEMPEIKMVFQKGEAVTIKEGPFENYEGTVDELIPEKGLVRVLVTIFGRQAPIELEEWQIAKAEEA